MRYLFLILLQPLITQAQFEKFTLLKDHIVCDKLEYAGDGLFAFEKQGKYGYINSAGKEIIPPVYEYKYSYSKTFSAFKDGLVILYKDKKLGMIDKVGKEVIPFEYDDLFYYEKAKLVRFSKKDNYKTLYGLMSVKGDVLLPAEYENIMGFEDFFTLKKGNLYGLANSTGKLILPISFSKLIPSPKNNAAIAQKDSDYGIIDLKGNWIFKKPSTVFELTGIGGGMVKAKVNNKYGYLNLKGEEVIISKYDMAYDFDESGLAKVGNKESPSSYTYYYGYVNKLGEEIIPLEHKTLWAFSNGLLCLQDKETNRYGYKNTKGQWIIKPVYVFANSFSDDGKASVKMTDGKLHLIDKTGKDLGITEQKLTYKDGFMVKETESSDYHLIDQNARILKKLPDYNIIYDFAQGMAIIRCNGQDLYGFMNLEGDKKVDCKYRYITKFEDGISRVAVIEEKSTKYGYINLKGEEMVPTVYESAGIFRNGWGLIKKESKYYYVNRSGDFKELPGSYDNVTEFRSGYSLGTQNGTNGQPNKYFYINTSLKEKISISAKEAYPFWDDVAVVKRESDYELMNTKGEIYKTLPSFETIRFCTEGMLAVREKGKWGFINKNGTAIVPPIYDTTTQFEFGHAKVKTAKGWGLIDKNGKEVIEPKYRSIQYSENGYKAYYDDAWVVMDKNNKVINDGLFTLLSEFHQNRAFVKIKKYYSIYKVPPGK